MKKGIIYSLLLSLFILVTSASLPITEYTFQGKVVDESGDPIIGCNLLIKHTKNEFITDFDGNFSFTAKDSCLTVITSYLGFTDIEVAICSNTSPLTITLKETAIELEEVMVTSTKASRSKKALGYSAMDTASGAARKSKPKKRVFEKHLPAVYDAKDVAHASPMIMDASSMEMEGPSEKHRVRMSAGQLTAAEWNDLKNWEDWLDISTEDLGEWGEQWKINPGKRYSTIVRNEDNTPLPNVTVQLFNKEGIVAWEGLTDNSGRVELWLASGKAAKIVAKYDGKTETIKRVRAYKKGINNITFKMDCPTVGGVEIVFVVDATGSMGDEIAYLQAELTDVLSRVTQTPIIEHLRTGAVFYRDHEDDYLIRQSPLSPDSKTTLSFIDNQSAGGGGDNPEAVEIGLEEAIQKMNWSEDAIARIVFFVLDAPPHQTPAIQEKLNKLMRIASQKGIRIIPMLASNAKGETEYIMRNLAIGTNGRLLFLTDDSGIGDAHAEPSVGPYRVEKANDLMFRLILEFAAFKPCQDNDNNTYQVVNNNNDKLEVSCYPVPANEFILVDLKTTIDKVEILDAQGKVITTQKDLPIGVTSIDIANLRPGSYFVKCTKGKKVETVKIIKV